MLVACCVHPEGRGTAGLQEPAEMARPLNTGLGVPGRGVHQQGPEPAPWVSWLQKMLAPTPSSPALLIFIILI